MSSKSKNKETLLVQQDYGEEEEYIQTVEDDIIDNKYSSTESIGEEKVAVVNSGEAETFRMIID